MQISFFNGIIIMEAVNYASLPQRSLFPREKAAEYGVQSLSDAELLALLIGSGCKEHSVHQLADAAKSILDREGKNGYETARALENVRGLGRAKTMMIAAAMELGKRRYSPGSEPIRRPEEVWETIRHLGDRQQEQFLVLCLNAAHVLVSRETVTIGLLNRSLVHPREVFRPAIELRSAAVIVAHNHPSGNLEPSREDMEVTTRLQKAGDLLGIPLLDHIVFHSSGWTSLREQGAFGI